MVCVDYCSSANLDDIKRVDWIDYSIDSSVDSFSAEETIQYRMSRDRYFQAQDIDILLTDRI